MNSAQQQTLQAKMTMYGVQMEDRTILSETSEKAEVLIGQAKGRPKRLEIAPDGRLVGFATLRP